MEISLSGLAKALGVGVEAIRQRAELGHFGDAAEKRNKRWVFDYDKAKLIADMLNIGGSGPAKLAKSIHNTVGADGAPEGDPDVAALGLGGKPGTFLHAKTQHEQAKAQIAMLDLEEKRGSLVQKEQVVKDAFAAFREARDSLLNIPPKVGPELSSMDDPFEISTYLDAQIREALEDLHDKLVSKFGAEVEDGGE